MIGILPAAGSATRIHGLPKYLLPVQDDFLIHRHALAMSEVGCRRVAIGSNPDNENILETYLEDIPLSVVWLAYPRETMTQTALSVCHSGRYEGDNILMGLADTYFDSDSPYLKLARALDKCDVAVAVFRARPGQHTHGGMVSFSHNRVTEVIDKPAETNLQYIWGALAWKPAFWDCLTPDMPHVGYGLPVAIERGLDVRAVICEGGFWDCGTPDEYFEMIRTLTGERVGA